MQKTTDQMREWGCTFDEFLDALRALEADGRIHVIKWPTTPDDTFRIRLLHARTLS